MILDSARSEHPPHWINAFRVVAYSKIFLLLFIAVAIVWIGAAKRHIDPEGKPLGADFIIFWGASSLGLHGHPADSYNASLLHQAQYDAIPGFKKVYPFFYPPTFYLLILPLALLPYFVAFWSFVLASLALYVSTFWSICKDRRALWCLAGFPGLWINLGDGQNGFLTAVISAGALLSLPRQPEFAGVLIGLLCIKPQFAVLFPFVLILTGAWRSLLIAAATAATLSAVATAILGVRTLQAWFASLPFIRTCLENGALPWIKMPTAFATLRLLHVPVPIAYAASAIVAVAAILLVLFVWHRSRIPGLRNAALMTGAFLVSPYAFDYDLAWLAFPIAWMGLEGVRTGWRNGEREILCAAWLLPIAIAPIARLTTLQIGPLVLLALLIAIAARARGEFGQGPSQVQKTPHAVF